MSEVQTQMAMLWSLKKVAEKIIRVKADVEKIPTEIDGLKATLKSSMNSFENDKLKIVALEKSVRDAESDSQLESEKLAKADAKLSGVKNNTEFNAATREQDDHKKLKAKNEEQVAKVTADLESKKANLATAQTGIAASQTKTAEECADLEKTLGKLRKELSALETDQAAKLKTLSSNISAIYTRISRSKGTPIAEIAGGFCGSCHVRVRPQLYNELLGFKQLHQCSNCGKLLIVPVPDGEVEPKTELSA